MFPTAPHFPRDGTSHTRRSRLLEARPADLAEVSEVNVTGALLGIQACVPLMKPGASIVNVGSDGGQSSHGGAKSISDALR
ncbi:SDR family oxidoreductase [Paenarthrobacter sp. 4246]|uniref:SDR family oxidoreductase n=1 Tax=Paenarthrobacter sp. 4246 TaxID=3156456 RepID=UPI00339AAB05